MTLPLTVFTVTLNSKSFQLRTASVHLLNALCITTVRELQIILICNVRRDLSKHREIEVFFKNTYRTKIRKNITSAFGQKSYFNFTFFFNSLMIWTEVYKLMYKLILYVSYAMSFIFANWSHTVSMKG